jgi:short subunit dehydrogenase-like uncharacterized protein
LSKTHDIIVFGATSFVGKILCRYLLTEYAGKPNSLTTPNWAIAARSAEKLADLLKELGDEGLDVSHLKTIVADSSDEKSLKAMCKQTAVLVSTVGPYTLYGETLVKVCAELGTDYCDLTGETPWVAKMIAKYEATAKASGARIVHCCGFDSIPSDMGVWFLQEQAKKQFKAPCPNVTMRVKKVKGTASGGTIASMLNIIKEASTDAELRKLLANPYSMCPADFGPKAKQFNQLLAAYDKNFDVWTAPFIMAGVNTRVVFRSNAVLNGSYSAANTPFTYSEAMMMGSGTVGRIKAMQFSAGLGGFALAAAVKPSRWALEKFLPKPGEGPNRQAQLDGFFDLRFHGKTASGQEIKIQVTGDQDPGYGSTGKMLGQAAMCLAFDIPKDKKLGGFWTPASLFGNLLVKRLQKHAGLTFEVI